MIDRFAAFLSFTMNDNASEPQQQQQQQEQQEPSACELRCRSQQATLAACVNSIRDAREEEEETVTAETTPPSESASNTGAGIRGVDTSCLAPSVAAWTECCSGANNGRVEVNSGHIGIY